MVNDGAHGVLDFLWFRGAGGWIWPDRGRWLQDLHGERTDHFTMGACDFASMWRLSHLLSVFALVKCELVREFPS
jgi:hypothetical protein